MNSIVWREFVVHCLIRTSGNAAELNEAVTGLLQCPIHKEERPSQLVCSLALPCAPRWVPQLSLMQRETELWPLQCQDAVNDFLLATKPAHILKMAHLSLFLFLPLGADGIRETLFHFSFLVGRTPWTGDQRVARPLPTQDNTNTEWTQTSMLWVGFEPTHYTAWPLRSEKVAQGTGFCSYWIFVLRNSGSRTGVAVRFLIFSAQISVGTSAILTEDFSGITQPLQATPEYYLD
jgi:hypothetical protein